jgi:hydroxymethylglutaryl-CoA lyase
MTMPSHVTIVDVGPRDGLQAEARIVPTATKIELIERLANAGVPVVEAGAFVSPKWVLQMADTADVLARITRHPGTRYPVLVPNRKGLDGAIAAGVEDIAIFGAASESFSQKNINCSISESLERFAPVAADAQAAGMRVRGYISCVLGCPYEGEVSLANVTRVARALDEMGCYEVSLGDTIGVGTPGKSRGPAGVAFSRHLRSGAGQYSCLSRSGCRNDRYSGCRTGRLPLCARRVGQCGQRGRGLHAQWSGYQHRS